MPFRFRRLEIPEVVLIEPVVFSDERGFFMEVYKYSEFSAFGITERFLQDNHSRSVKGVLRGLHYQNPPRAQGKLVRVLQGEIFDVAVDIRRGSPTYGKWVGVRLSSENRFMLYIPPGFAHGFCVLSDYAEVHYKVTDEYSPEHEAGIIWNDPEIGIDWPVESPILSERDSRWPRLSEAENRFVYGGPR
ncbi:MAG: dTDP-4-dehydrorhamnose 3,5-epimerase [Deltaproteobacteria bacterium]|nr:MAG: dTDP-4-dehydrorhamnose 3,5-epimerase [Deltaproteobacteria bacterium]